MFDIILSTTDLISQSLKTLCDLFEIVFLKELGGILVFGK